VFCVCVCVCVCIVANRLLHHAHQVNQQRVHAPASLVRSSLDVCAWLCACGSLWLCVCVCVCVCVCGVVRESE